MEHRYRFGRFELRQADRQLSADGSPVPIGSRAFDLLACLIERRDRVVSKEEVFDLVWPSMVVEENNLSVQVSTLRKILGAKAIATIPNRGYRFAMEVLAQADAPPAPAPVKDSPAHPAQPARPAIAVLPFSVLTDERGAQFLADGLTEDVIALLARVPGFLLISHASSSFFRNRSVPLPDIARQLGVRYVVEGSVRPTGDTLRVSTQLTEASSGHVLWSGRFEIGKGPDASHALQDGIARGIISQLEPELTRAEIAHIRRQRPENQDAWAHYHQAVGTIALKGWRKSSVTEARDQLQRCIGLDPSFGLGHAYQALLTALAKNLALLPGTPQLEADVLNAAERAITLDEGSAEVLGYAGCALCDIGHRERGDEILRQALSIDPSNAQAHVALGASLAMIGQFETGIDKMRHGMAISPRDRRLGYWGWALAAFLLKAGRTEEALAEARAAGQRDPTFYPARIMEASALAALDQVGEARQALRRARELHPQLTLDEIAMTHGKRTGQRLTALWNMPDTLP